jgi:uncharacterized cupredoxin-like copper-binding protein
LASAITIAAIIVVILIVGAVYFSFFNSQNSPGTSTTTTTIKQAQTTVPTTTQSTTTVPTSVTTVPTTVTTINQSAHPQSITFNVTETDYSIAPSTFNAYANQKIIFNVTNNGAQTHDLGIWGLGSGYGTPQLNPHGGFGQFQFTTTTPGNYQIYSNVGGDQQRGMIATLYVH